MNGYITQLGRVSQGGKAKGLQLLVCAVAFGDPPVASAAEVVEDHEGVVALAAGAVGPGHVGDSGGNGFDGLLEVWAFFAVEGFG